MNRIRIQSVAVMQKNVAGENIENQAGLVARYLEWQGPKLAKAVSNKSKILKEQKKFTPEETAAIVSSTKCPIAQWIKCALLTTKVKVLSFVSKKYAFLE